MKIWISILALISSPIWATEAEWNQAELAYRQGHFREARAIYERLAQANPTDGLYYNIANTYVKTGEWAIAKAYYLKARKIAPRDSDIAHNLAAIETHFVGSTHQLNLQTGWQRFCRYLSYQEWQILGLLLWTTGSLLAVGQAWGLKRTRGVAILAFGLTLGVTGVIWKGKAVMTDQDGAVFTGQKQAVKEGPSDQLSTLFFIHEGVELKIMSRLDEWAQVKLPSGESGWIKGDHYIEL